MSITQKVTALITAVNQYGASAKTRIDSKIPLAQKTTTKNKTDCTGFLEKITSKPAKKIINASPKKITSVNMFMSNTT